MLKLLTYIAGIVGAVVFWTGLIVLLERLEDYIRKQLATPLSFLWYVHLNIRTLPWRLKDWRRYGAKRLYYSTFRWRRRLANVIRGSDAGKR
jgi:hypothetical protein